MSRSNDNYEREIKFPGVELEKLRERLIELEAERRGPTAFEDNWILDRDNELMKHGKILRLRTDGGRARLTFKGPMRLEGNLKIREENEIEVENAEQATALLRNLGYSVVAPNLYSRVGSPDPNDLQSVMRVMFSVSDEAVVRDLETCADYVRARESLDRLRGIAARMVLPGHGDAFTGGVDEAVRLAREAPFPG